MGTHCPAQEQCSALTQAHRKLTAPLEAQVLTPALGRAEENRSRVQSTAELHGSCGNAGHTAQSGAM